MKQHFKDLIKRNRWIKWVPNALTLGNSLCGFAAILYTLQVYEKMMYRDGSDGIEKIFAFSACMILFAMVFDAFDGYAARLLNAASLHGIQMDSLADMVTFGVAPATLVAVMAHSMRSLAGNQFRLVWCLCAIYLGCAALRLAKYNVHAILEKKSSDKFSGLPSPGAAGRNLQRDDFLRTGTAAGRFRHGEPDFFPAVLYGNPRFPHGQHDSLSAFRKMAVFDSSQQEAYADSLCGAGCTVH